jgi:hypothetical protein
MILFCADAIRVSLKVVLPWSTWARTQIFLILDGNYCNSFTFSSQVSSLFWVAGLGSCVEIMVVDASVDCAVWLASSLALSDV